MATSTATGTFTFTAANGDELWTVTEGAQNQFIPPNVSVVSLAAQINGGTGRFAGASGQLTIHLRQEIDYANARASGAGSFVGELSLAR